MRMTKERLIPKCRATALTVSPRLRRSRISFRWFAVWCALNPEGVLVLMAHQNYFHRRTGKWQLEMPSEESTHLVARQSEVDMIGTYFAEARKIILPIAVFVTDGDLREDGTWSPSVFDHATGDFYEGRMAQFGAAPSVAAFALQHWREYDWLIGMLRELHQDSSPRQ
jgi:hypothetical protein